MQNYDVAVKATSTSINSQGSAMQENARYLESAQAKVNKLKVAWEELALSAGNTVFIDMITMITSDLRYLINSIDALISLDFSKGNLVAGFTMLAGITGGLTTLMNGGIRNMVFSDNYMQQLQEKLSGVTGAYQEATKKANSLRLAQQNAIPIGNQSITMMDRLKGSAHATAGGFRVAGAAVGGFVKTVGAAVATSLGIGVVIGAVTMAVGALIAQFTKYRAEIAKKKQEQKELIKAYGDNAETIDMLADRYDALQSKTNRSAEETELMYSTAKSLGGYLPELVTHVDELGRTHLTSATSAKEYVNSLKEMQQIQFLEKADKSLKNLTENEEALEKATKNYEKLLELKKKSDKEYANDKEMSQGAVSDSAIYSVGSDDTSKSREQDKIKEMMTERDMKQAEMERLNIAREHVNLIIKASDEYTKLNGEQQSVIDSLSEGIDSETINEAIAKATEDGTLNVEKLLLELEKVKQDILDIAGLVGEVPSFDETLFKSMSGSQQSEAAKKFLNTYVKQIGDLEREQQRLLDAQNVQTSDGLDGGYLQQYKALEQAKISVANQGRAVVQAAESEKVAIDDATASVIMQNAKMDDTQRAAHSALAGVSDLAEGNNELADSAERAMTATQMLEQALGYQEGELAGIIDKAETYNDILFKMAEGHQFTASEMMQLIDKYPELIDSFEITNGVVSVNTGLVEELREAQRLQFEEKMKQATATRLQEEFTAKFSGEMTAQRIAGITSIAEAEKALVLVKQEAAKEIAAIENKMNNISPDDPNYGRQMYAGDMIGRINADFSGMDTFIQNMKKSEENARKIMATVTTPTKDLYNANKAAETANKATTESEKNKQDTISKSIYITNKYTEAIDKATAAVERQNKIKNAQVRGSKAYVTQALGEIKLLERQKKAVYDYIQVLRKANDQKKIIAGTGVHTSTTDVVTDPKGNVISTGKTYKDYDIVANGGSFKKTGSKKLSGWNGVNSGFGGVRTTNGMTWKHEGIDLAGKNGERLDSNVNGTVVWAGKANKSLGIPSAYGNNVVIQSTDGNYHIYAHLNKITAKKGSKIGAGQQIGTIGSTGNSTGAHLHYEVRSKMGKWNRNLVNPTAYAKQASSSKRNTYTFSSGGSSAPVAKTSTSSFTKVKNNQGKGALNGLEYLFNQYGEKYGVDPALALAIAHWETGNGTSDLLKNKNNVGGMYDSKNGTFFKFDSLEQGIESMIKNLQKNYISQGLTSIESIQKKYAPNAAGNDPNGLNQYWTDGVKSMYRNLTGGSQSASGGGKPSSSATKDKSQQSQRDAERQANLAEQKKEEEAQRKAYAELLEQISEVTYDYLSARADIFKRMYDNYNYDEEVIRQRIEMTESATRESAAALEELKNNARLQTRSVKLELEQMQRDRKSSRYKDLSNARKAEFDERMKQLERQLKLEKFEELKVVQEIANERRAIREKLYNEQMRKDREMADFYSRKLAVMDEDSNADLVEKYALTVEQEKLERQNHAMKRRQLEAEKSHLQQVRSRYGVNSEMYKQQLEAVERYREELLQIEDTVNSINESQKNMLESMTSDIIDTIRDAFEKQREAEIKSIDDIQESRMKAIEHERNARKKAHEDTLKEMDEERDRINKYFDERMKQLEDADDARSHDKQMSDFAKREKEIRSSLNRISLDDSFEAQAKRKELNKELEALNEERDEYLYSRNLDKQKEALQNERDAYLENIDKKQESEDEAYEKFEETLDRREEAETELYEKMKEQLNQYYDDILNDERKWNAIREQAMKGNFDEVKRMANEMLIDTSKGFRQIIDNMGETYKGVLEDLSYIYADAEYKTVALSDATLKSFADIVHTASNSFDSLGNVIQTNYIDKLKEALELMSLLTGKDFNTDAINPKEKDSTSDPNGSGGYFMYAKQKGSADAINVRESASGNAKVIGTLVDGQKYQVLEQTANNSKIRFSNGTTGWVSNSELSDSASNNPWGALFSNTHSKEVGKYKNPIDDLLRSYSTTGAAHKGRLQNIAYESGKRVYDDAVTGSTDRIKAMYEAAMNKYYSDFESASSTAERNKAIDSLTASLKAMQDDIDRAKRELDALYQDLQGATTINKKSSVTMDSALYSDPYGSSNNILATIKKGTQIEVLKDRGLYYEVMYGSKKGYVNKNRVASFDTGGWYTGNFEGDMPAFLHKKELVLDQQQTQNMLKTVEFTDRLISPLRALVGKMQSVKSSTPVPTVHIENINNDFSNNEIKDGKGASEDFMKHTMNLINNKFGKR